MAKDVEKGPEGQVTEAQGKTYESCTDHSALVAAIWRRGRLLLWRPDGWKRHRRRFAHCACRLASDGKARIIGIQHSDSRPALTQGPGGPALSAEGSKTRPAPNW